MLVEFVADVEVLRGELDHGGRRRGEVLLTVYHEDEALQVTAQLSAEQYERALRVHMLGASVWVRGELSRIRGLATLNEITAMESRPRE